MQTTISSSWYLMWCLMAAIELEYIHLLLPAVTHYHMKANAIDWTFLCWVDLIRLCTLSHQSNTVMCNFTRSEGESKPVERRGSIVL